MAVIGMRYPVAATITTETEGSALVYGTGMVLAKAIRANFTYNRSDNPLYADDTIAENDNGLTGYDIELELDKLTDDVRATILGEVSTGTTESAYEQTDAAAPYVGFGFIRILREGGTDKYMGVWCYKCQFSESGEESNTKGESIEWGTPTLNAKGMGVKNDSTGKIKYRKHKTFDTIAAALAWLNGIANIPAAATT